MHTLGLGERPWDPTGQKERGFQGSVHVAETYYTNHPITHSRLENQPKCVTAAPVWQVLLPRETFEVICA